MSSKPPPSRTLEGEGVPSFTGSVSPGLAAALRCGKKPTLVWLVSFFALVVAVRYAYQCMAYQCPAYQCLAYQCPTYQCPTYQCPAYQCSAYQCPVFQYLKTVAICNYNPNLIFSNIPNEWSKTNSSYLRMLDRPIPYPRDTTSPIPIPGPSTESNLTFKCFSFIFLFVIIWCHNMVFIKKPRLHVVPLYTYITRITDACTVLTEWPDVWSCFVFLILPLGRVSPYSFSLVCTLVILQNACNHLWYSALHTGPPLLSAVRHKLYFRISINLRSHPRLHKLHFSLIGPVPHSKLLSVLRQKLKISLSQELYLFHESRVITSDLIWAQRKIKLSCFDDSCFGTTTGTIQPTPTSPDNHVSIHNMSRVSTAHEIDSDSEISGSIDPMRSKRRELAKYTISALYSNTCGLSKNKVEAIRQEAATDTFILGTEWNKTPKDATLVANFFGKLAVIKSSHKTTYDSLGNRISVECKKLGYGTGIVTKDANNLSKYLDLNEPDDKTFEIVATNLLLATGTKIACICVYRSPSMKHESEIGEFYDQINRYLKHMKNDSTISGIIYIGDPNTESSIIAKNLEKGIMQRHELTDLIEGVPTRVGVSGNETQPDSCYSWFDCTKITITASVIGRICDKMDHRAIRLKMVLNGTPPKEPKFKKVVFKKRKKYITDDQIKKKLRDQFSNWLFKYRTLLYDVKNEPRPDSCVIADDIIDAATTDFLECIENTKKYAWTTQTAYWPTETPDDADHLTVQIAQISSKLGALSFKMQKNGKTSELLREFKKLELEKLQLMRRKVKDRVELCMRHQLDNAYPKQYDTLFTWTKKLLARDGFLENMRDAKTEDQILKELDECDATFTNSDPSYNPDLDGYTDVAPDRKFSVDSWDPVGADDDLLADYISKKKKIDKLYTCNASALSNPTFVLLKLIEKNNYFPKILRNSKLTILPSRFIFSLDALPKIVESILAIEFNSCFREDYANNGDPHQMAYEPKRGTTSCNSITYTHVDINLANGQPCLQSFIDVRKAFNAMHRGLMLRLMQKLAGAGRVCATRFAGRTYTAPSGERRGETHNRGVDAGCPIPVSCFKVGINSDVALTGLNKELDWASLYSDDRSALAKCARILQSALSKSAIWAKKHGILYHDGVSCCLNENGISECKKFPALLIYAKKGMEVPPDFYNITLDEIPLKVTAFQRNLGLNVYTKSSSGKYKHILDKYGYYFIPEIDRIKALAYRMQDIKFDFVPQFLRMMILCYFCGIINFSACLYWLRSSKKDMDRLRYYYAMGLSAVIGETTMGTLGAACCKSMSVGDDSKRMQVLRDMVGVKSLREIAKTDAVATIKQVADLRPEWFRRNNDKRRRHNVCRLGINDDRTKTFENKHEAVIAAKLPTVISEEIVATGALIGDIWRLACDKVIDDEARSPDVNTMYKFEDLWLLAEETCMSEVSKPSVSEIMLTYHALCRQFLGTSEVQARRLANLTVSRPLKRSRKCVVSAPKWSKNKRRKPWSFSCQKEAPKIDGVVEPCAICGYEVNFIKLKNLGLAVESSDFCKCKRCMRSVHSKCVDKLRLKKSLFYCNNVSRYLGRDAIELTISAPDIGPKPLREDMKCLICGDEFYSDATKIECTETGCKYGAHEICAAVLAKINDSALDVPTFQCNQVNYYLKPNEVSDLVVDDIVKMKAMESILRFRGKINVSSYTPKRVRYENPDVECEHCGGMININEDDHCLAYCRARYAGTPIPTRDYEYVLDRSKRIRRMALKDYIP